MPVVLAEETEKRKEVRLLSASQLFARRSPLESAARSVAVYSLAGIVAFRASPLGGGGLRRDILFGG